ncbi:unnamed protein product, partial [Allacma fusca]
MGFRVKPAMMVVVGVVVLALLVSVGFVSYKLKGTTSALRSSSSAVGIFSDHPSSSDNEIATVVKTCDSPAWECNIRLEPNVYPLHYDLFLHPDFDTGLFSGKVTIELNITSSVDHIRLHTKSLNI